MSYFVEKKKSKILFLPGITPELCEKMDTHLSEKFVETILNRGSFTVLRRDQPTIAPLAAVEVNTSDPIQVRTTYAKPDEDFPQQPSPYSMIFTDVASWPTRSDLLCQNCIGEIKTYPRYVPGNRLQNVRKGFFCSYACAAYWISLQPISDQWEMYVQLKNEFFVFTGRRIITFLKSPDKEYKRSFGGTMTEREYADKIAALEDLHT